MTGDAFDPTLAHGGRFDARWLDQVIAGRPVVLRTTDHHTMWVNSEALRRAGIDAGTPEPAAGQIVRRADGSPLGTLREWGAIGPVLDLLPAPGPAEQGAALAGVSALFAAAGITWVQDAWVDPDQVDAWLAAAAAGTLRFRANLAFRAEPTIWKDQLSEFAADRDRVSAHRPGLADRPDGEVLRRRRRGGRHRRPAAALRRLPALARDRQLDGRPSSPTR